MCDCPEPVRHLVDGGYGILLSNQGDSDLYCCSICEGVFVVRAKVGEVHV